MILAIDHVPVLDQKVVVLSKADACQNRCQPHCTKIHNSPASVYHGASKSENQFRSELDLAIVAARRANRPEGRCAEGRAGVAESRRIEEIKELAAELEFGAFA